MYIVNMFIFFLPLSNMYILVRDIDGCVICINSAVCDSRHVFGNICYYYYYYVVVISNIYCIYFPNGFQVNIQTTLNT